MKPEQLDTVDISDLAGFSDWWTLKDREISELLAYYTNSPFSSTKRSIDKPEQRQLESVHQFLNEMTTTLSSVQPKAEDEAVELARIQAVAEGHKTAVEALLKPIPAQASDSGPLTTASKQRKLFTQADIEPLPTGAPFISSIQSQIRKDLWGQGEDGIAVFTKVGKRNPSNYIEHYISSPGDVSMLPWDQAEEIINKFGFTTVKLQLILAAHAMNQSEPWSGSFTLSGADLIRDLGWDARKDIPMTQKLSELASAALALDCLLVKVEWEEGVPRRGKQVKVTIQTSRMWNIALTATGQRNLLTENLDDIERLELLVQPGLWTKGFLNKGGARARDALYQFGYLGQNVLRIDPYHDELALRLAIHLTLESRIHKSGEYRVITLLQYILPGCDEKIAIARENRFKARDLLDQWNRALKTLMNLGWSVSFGENFSESLKPDSQARRTKGYIEPFLEGKLIIQPPSPIPELLSGKSTPDGKAQPKVDPVTLPTLTGDQIRSARKAKGWSQAKLAGTANLSQQLISHLESGRRDITPEVEARLRKILKIED